MKDTVLKKRTFFLFLCAFLGLSSISSTEGFVSTSTAGKVFNIGTLNIRTRKNIYHRGSSSQLLPLYQHLQGKNIVSLRTNTTRNMTQDQESQIDIHINSPATAPGIDGRLSVTTESTRSMSLGMYSPLKKYITAGQSTPKRMMHFGLGIGSLLFGGLHFFKMITTLNGGFAIETTQIEVFLVGFLHISTAFYGISLLRKRKSDASRNDMIWPIPYQNLWMISLSLSEWSRGSNALIDMTSMPMMLFSVSILVIALWQIPKSFVSNNDHCGIWWKSPGANAALAFVTYIGFVVLLSSLAIGICIVDMISPGHGKEFVTNLVDAYPGYGYCVSNVFMNFAWSNNVAASFATLLKYGVLDIQLIQIFFIMLIILSNWAILTTLTITDVGTGNELFLKGLISSLTGDFI